MKEVLNIKGFFEKFVEQDIVKVMFRGKLIVLNVYLEKIEVLKLII